MALTRITKGVIKPNENYDTHNINSTGIVTAIGLDVNGNGDISGNLSVGGVLTYEDVTSIDSVGIITAQSDVHVGGGVSAVGVGTFGSLDIGGDIDVDGHTNLDNVSIAGVTTFAGGISASTLTASSSIAAASLTASSSYPTVTLNDTDSENDYQLRNANGTFAIHDLDASANRLTINSSGVIDLNGNVEANRDLDVDGHTNLDNGNVAGIVTFNSGAALHMNGGQILLYDRPDGNSNNLFFGTGGRAVAYHDGTGFSLTNNVGHAYIGVGVGSKDLYLYAQASGNVLLQQNTGVRYVKGVGSDASVQLFFNNNLRLNTTTAGVSIPKDLDVDGHTNLDNVSVAGVTTFASTIVGANATFSGNINNSPVGNGSISGFGAITIQAPTPALNFTETDANPDYRIIVLGGQFRIQDVTNSNANRFIINTDGTTSIEKNLNCLSDLDVDGHTNLDNVSIAGVTTTGNLSGSNANFTGELTVAEMVGHTGDTHTKLSFPANDTIAFTTGGTERLRITSSGHVGIGTDAPAGGSSLHIQGGGTSDKPHIRLTADRGLIARLGDTSGGAQAMFDLYDTDGSTQIVRFISGGGDNFINTGGNFGVGTNSPSSIIHATGSNSSTGYYFKNTHTTSGFGMRIEGGGTTADRYSLAVFNAAGNEKFRVNANGHVGVNEPSPQRYFHATGNASTGCAHFGVFGTNAGNSYVGNTPVVTISTDGNGNAGTNDEKAIFQVGRGGGGAGAAAVTKDLFRVNLGGSVQIGGAVGNNSDIDIANTKLTIKQTANNREDGIYIERTGERRGWLMFVGGSGNYNDAFCLSTNQMGTKTDVLAIDRGNRLAKLGGDVIIDGTNNGYGGLRIYDDTSGGYNVNYVGGRSDGNMCHKFFGGGRSQNQSPWTDASGFEIMRISLSNGLQLAGDTDSALQFHTGDHYKFKTKGRERVHLDNRGVLTAPKLSTKALIFSPVTSKWGSQRTVTNFVMQFYTGASSATYHFMRMISQPDWAFDDVEIRQYRYQYNPSGSDHTVRRYYTYYSGHNEQIVRYNQQGSGTGTGNDNYISKRTDFGPGGSMTIHQASNGGYYRDAYGSDYSISLGAYYGVVLEIKITATVGIYDTGDYPTAYDFYPANFGGQATQTNANNWNGPRGVWFNTTSNGTGTGTAPVISTKNSDRGWSTGANFLDTSA